MNNPPLPLDPQKPQRKSTRLKNFDYRTAGLYFVTILTDGRKPALSFIKDNKIILSDNGKIADNYWKDIPGHYPNGILDEYIIMPDHLHGIIGITEPLVVRARRPRPYNHQPWAGSSDGLNTTLPKT